MIYLKTPEELELMQQACTLVSRTLGEVAKHVAPGVTTLKLDTIAREFMLDNGGRPACLGYGGFPATLCIEVNETVVHGSRRTTLYAKEILWAWTLLSNSTGITGTCAIRLP